MGYSYSYRVTLFNELFVSATRLTFSNKMFGYYERLRKLRLATLETRRLWGDIIEVHKIFKESEDVS